MGNPCQLLDPLNKSGSFMDFKVSFIDLGQTKL